MSVLSGHARVAGIAGWPVTYSRSPRLHGFWLRRHGIDGTYIPLPIRPGEFSVAMRGLLAAGFAGANVTIPHKIAAFDICDSVDDTARRAGAVNTLVFNDGKVVGSNTDGYGFVANLRSNGVNAAAGPALLLGAGGSARAVAAALQDAGAIVTVANRTRARAEALAHDLPGLHVIDWNARVAALADHALAVNTTPLGMVGHQPLDLDLSSAPRILTVADNVYVPRETPLLAAARACGLRTIEGLGMLLHQAVPGFHAWFGVEPQVDEELRQFVAVDLPIQ
jgi:shikimate dehydrogenase